MKLLILNLYIFLFSNLLQNIGICYIWTYMALRRTFYMAQYYKRLRIRLQFVTVSVISSRVMWQIFVSFLCIRSVLTIGNNIGL